MAQTASSLQVSFSLHNAPGAVYAARQKARTGTFPVSCRGANANFVLTSGHRRIHADCALWGNAKRQSHSACKSWHFHKQLAGRQFIVESVCKGCRVNPLQQRQGVQAQAGSSEPNESDQVELEKTEVVHKFPSIARFLQESTSARFLASAFLKRDESEESGGGSFRKQAVAAFMVALALTGAAAVTEPSGAFVTAPPRRLQGEELQTVNLFQKNTPSVVYITNLAVR